MALCLEWARRLRTFQRDLMVEMGWYSPAADLAPQTPPANRIAQMAGVPQVKDLARARSMAWAMGMAQAMGMALPTGTAQAMGMALP